MAATAMARETFVALRHAIAKIEGRLAERLEPAGADAEAIVLRRIGVPAEGLMEIGSPTLDKALGGGIPRSGLTEIHGSAMRDSGAVGGFALGLTTLLTASNPSGPLLWIAPRDVLHEAGRPYAPGLFARFSIAPHRLVTAEAPKPIDTLWIAEEAANAGVFATIILEMRGSPAVLDLTATRRLHRRGLMSGRPILLLRESGLSQPTAAPVRLRVEVAPAGLRHTLEGPLEGSIGPPAITVSIDKSRTALPATAILEWTHDAFQERPDQDSAQHAALPRPVVPLPAVGSRDAQPSRQVLAFRGSSEPADRIQPAREQHPTRRRHGRAR